MVESKCYDTNIVQYKAEGNAAFAAKDFNKAVELFTKAIEASETPNHVLYSNRSGSYASLRDYDSAAKDAEECIKINPSWAKGYTRKGAAYHGLGDLVTARDAYEEALKLDPANAQAKSGLASVDAAIQQEAAGDGQTPDLGMGSLFKDPATFAKLANHPKTSEYMKDPAFVAKLEGLQNNPMAALTGASSDPRLMEAMAVILGIEMPAGAGPGSGPAPSSSEPKPAESAKPKEPEPEPEPVDTDKQKADEEKSLGNAAYKKRQFDEAITHYNNAWDIFKDITYLNNRAAAEFEKGDYDEAIKTCLYAIEQGRELRSDYKLFAKAYSRIGTTYLKKDDLPSAIEYFNKSLTEHRTPDVLNKLRSTEKELKKREAESYIDPEKAEEAREEGNKLFKEGDWPGAVKAYTEAIKRAPKDPRGYANRAAALLKLIAYPEVIKDCDIAISLDPNFFKAYTRKATAYYVMKDYRNCMDTLEVARSIDTEFKHTREIEELYTKASTARFAALPGETAEQTAERLSQDPEIDEIRRDPVMNTILQQAQNDPAALRDHLQNPEIRRKINLLAAAGIIRTR
ncbi:Hsp90 cochaperone STI1 [Sugiyamaella lignohabitans]|uniref:Hsp90 cochaperone STI1 n=1 Tax=Sugiyamaella lignohabitans TaxID=796027 RepID=A0A167DKN2_9ASCO|nr:Hsp90 cochaperone STI1 [Sugiyamaella lignohabitans]ANB13018.1 Hsp90 cochaperone STI1 [Sugiyamaella lignohabitans]